MINTHQSTRKTAFITLSSLSIAVLVFLFALIQSCTPDNLTLPDGTPVFSHAHVYGVIMNENLEPIAGAEVAIFNTITTTNEQGIFNLKDAIIVKSDIHLTAKKQGYFDKFYTSKVRGETNLLKIVMTTQQTTTISSNMEATIEMEQANLTLPSNAYVTENGEAYTGTVQVAYQYYPPDEDNFSLQMPGGDFRGITANGEETLLQSFGAFEVNLTDEAGNKLQLAPGSEATISATVPSNLLAYAPATAPLWYFNESTFKWEEEGSVTLEGNEYVGTVSHFSGWNIDIPVSDRAAVSGYVVDCNNEPLANMAVLVGPLVIYTNEEGYYFSNIAVGYDFNVKINANLNFNYNSQTIEVTAMNEDEYLELENLEMPCVASIEGQVVDCDYNTTDAIVYATWEDGFNFTSTNNGDFTLLVNGDDNISIHAITDDLLGANLNTTSVAEETLVLTEPLWACEEVTCSFGTLEVAPLDSTYQTIVTTAVISADQITINMVYDILGFEYILEFVFNGTSPGDYIVEDGEVQLNLTASDLDPDAMLENLEGIITIQSIEDGKVAGIYDVTGDYTPDIMTLLLIPISETHLDGTFCAEE